MGPSQRRRCEQLAAHLGRRCCAAATTSSATAPPTTHPLHAEEVDGEQAYLHVFAPTVTSALAGTAVVVCPGGGYGGLAMEGGVGEPSFGLPGEAVAQWLAEHGVVACLLQYRLPAGRKAVPLTDCQLAIRAVRDHAAAWAIEPSKVGIIGFSAGGHLAGSAATLFTGPSDRPDFAILVYPVVTMAGDWRHQGSVDNLLGEEPAAADLARFSLEQQVTADTPPTFLTHALDDAAVPVENARRFAAACWGHGVDSQLLELSDGGHGLNGYRGPNWEAWKGQAVRWMHTVVNGAPAEL
jgi:acetyl esterase/lipase